MKKKLEKFLDENIEKNISKKLEIPKIKEFGDFSLPCFSLIKIYKSPPQEISKNLAEKFSKKLPDFLLKIENKDSFLNFFFNSKKQNFKILNSVETKKIFSQKTKNPKKILIEFPSPNTNKQLHIGHIRNIFLGKSLCKILSEVGHKIIKTNLNNDRGIAVCKVMLAYKLYGEKKTPKDFNMKSDEFVSFFYRKFEEENDKETVLEMKLYKEPFNEIFLGKKKIEFRLFDEKRKKIKIDDLILFQNFDDKKKKILVKVKKLHKEKNFEKLYKKLNLENSSEAYKIYSKEDVKKFGCIGIEFEKVLGKKLEIQAQNMLKKWEEENLEIRNLWKKILNWVFEGYKKTYENYNLNGFDKEFFESDIYDKGREIVEDAFKKKFMDLKKMKQKPFILTWKKKGLEKNF